MNSYPIFIKSFLFEKAEISKPILPEKPLKPSEPKLIKKNWFESLILWCDDGDDVIINNKRLDKYNKSLEEYRSNLIQYNKMISSILSNTNIRIYRELKKKESLLLTFDAKKSDRDTLKGRHENFFYNYLIKQFGDKILNDLEFELPNGNAFVPDFAYVDKKTGLCIDIEIDEPYTIDDDEKIPIHYSGADDYRNKFFASKGWFVVRFAEIQIARYPKYCCDYIENIISYITEGIDIPTFILNVDTWNYSDSILMIKDNFRDNY